MKKKRAIILKIILMGSYIQTILLLLVGKGCRLAPFLNVANAHALQVLSPAKYRRRKREHMTQKEQIVSTLEESLKVLEIALNEREQQMRGLLYAFNVSNLEDINDLESYKMGAELSDQIDRLKDLIDDLKYQMRYIGAFQNI